MQKGTKSNKLSRSTAQRRKHALSKKCHTLQCTFIHEGAIRPFAITVTHGGHDSNICPLQVPVFPNNPGFRLYKVMITVRDRVLNSLRSSFVAQNITWVRSQLHQERTDLSISQVHRRPAFQRDDTRKQNTWRGEATNEEKDQKREKKRKRKEKRRETDGIRGGAYRFYKPKQRDFLGETLT